MTHWPMRALQLLILFLTASQASGQTAPWVAGSVRFASDNQPLRRLAVAGEYGRYLSPAATASLHAATERASDVILSSVLAGATLALPSARLGMRARAGAALDDTGAAFVYHLSADVAAGAGVSVRAAAARERYSRTLSSLGQSVYMTTRELALDRAAAPGWAGEAVVRRESFDDDNRVISAYTWILAPLSRSTRHAFRAGAATSLQDSDTSTWQPLDFPGGAQPGDQLAGHYTPYYTPSDIVAHSVIANAALLVGATWLIADVSVGVRATEQAPVLHRGSSSFTRSFHERSFTPYRIALTAAAPLDDRTGARIAFDHARTAYYRVTTVTLALQRSLAR